MSTTWDQNDVREGMHVTGSNGKRLGKVIRAKPESFVVEKGMFFPKDYELRYERINTVGVDDITYELSDFDLRVGGGGEATRSALAATAAARASTAAAARGRATEVPAPAATATAAPATTATTARAAAAETAGGLPERHELHVPLMEEEIGVEKVARETGHLRIRKTIKTEERHFTVPVTREDVVIERITATSEEPMLPPEMAFKEETLDLPLHEEDVRVTKRPRVREEMVVRTVVQAVEKEAAATLRHEEAEIEDTRSAAERRMDGAPASPGVSSDSSGYGAPGRSDR
jgi:uncharacterized protein (TIGR02271 family)